MVAPQFFNNAISQSDQYISGAISFLIWIHHVYVKLWLFS